MMLKIKEMFKQLVIEAKEKWRELSFLFVLSMAELYAFSTLVLSEDKLSIVLTSSIIIGLILLFLTLSLIHKKPTKEEWKKFAIFVAIALILGIARSYLYIFSLLVAYLFSDDLKKMFKWIFIISVLTGIGFVFLVMIRWIPDHPFYRDYDNYSSIRHSLGFVHSNLAMRYIFITTLSGYLWLANNKKQTLIYTLCMLPIVGFIAYITNCKTGMLVMAGTFVLMNLPACLIKWIKTNWLYLVFIVITIMLTISYPLKMYWLNDLLSTRPYWFYRYVSSWPLYMISGKCYYPLLIHLQQYPLDNSYLFTLFDGGIFATIAICYIFNKAFKDNKDTKLLVAVIAILTYGLTEALVTVFTNLLFVIIFALILNNKKEKSGELL